MENLEKIVEFDDITNAGITYLYIEKKLYW